jgi:hypothetical protein
MACYNMIIPYLVPSMPAAQKEALHELVKEPLVYVSVALDNWRAFAKAGISGIQFPQAWFQSADLDPWPWRLCRAEIARRSDPAPPPAFPTNPACPNTTRAAPAAWNCSAPTSPLTKPASATCSPAPWASTASMPTRISWPSP